MARVAAIEVLLLDIGGVLVELSGLPQWRAWTGLEDDEGWHHWLHSPAVRAFESGRSSADEFGVQMVDEFDLPVSAEEFVEAFAAWPTGLLEGASDLLRELRDQPFRLACFSNTNELHWPRFIDDFGLRASLDVHFASHELGLLKPDAESFTEVTRQLGCTPDRILFLDDNKLNVDGALSAGLQAERVTGTADTRRVLSTRALLP